MGSVILLKFLHLEVDCGQLGAYTRPMINKRPTGAYPMTTEMQKIHDGTIERLIRELASDLRDLVETGDLTEAQANEWMVHKQDQWAMGLN